MNTRNILLLLLLVILLMTFEAVAMTLLTAYVRDRDRRRWKLILGVVLYGLMIPLFLLYGLRYTGIAVLNLLWNICTTIVMIAIGYYLFHEHLNHLHLISLFLALAAGVTLYLADKKG